MRADADTRWKAVVERDPAFERFHCPGKRDTGGEMEPFEIGDTVYHRSGDAPPMTVVSLEQGENGYMVTCRWKWFVGTPSQEHAFPDRVLTTERPYSQDTENSQNMT